MSRPGPISRPQFWGQDENILKLVRRKGLKVGQIRNRVSQRGSVGSWKQLHTPLLAAAESTLMCKTEHSGGKSEDVFLFFELTHLKQRASVSKFAPSHLNEFQLEVKYEEGEFVSGQKNLLQEYCMPTKVSSRVHCCIFLALV